MTTKIKIKLGGMSNSHVHSSTSRYIAALPALFLLVGTKKPSVMPLLDNNKSDARFIIGFQFDARLSNSCQLVLQKLQKLALRHSVPVQNYPMGFVTTRRFIKHNQQFPARKTNVCCKKKLTLKTFSPTHRTIELNSCIIS